MAIVSDIVYHAMRLCGIRDTSDATIVAQALYAFNLMLRSWNEAYHYYRTTESFDLTVGTGSYTIGSGTTFDTVRPQKLYSAFIRYSTLDEKVNVNLSQEEYNEISYKSVSQHPTALFYDPTYPNGTIYFDYLPSEVGTLYLTSYKPFTTYNAITDTLLEPPELEKALAYCLAVDLAPEYGVQLMPTVVQQAQEEKYTIGVRNMTPVSNSNFDPALLR